MLNSGLNCIRILAYSQAIFIALCLILVLHSVVQVAGNNTTAHLLLSPCCLPRKGPGWPAQLYESPDPAEQYRRWVSHVEDEVRRRVPGARTGVRFVAGILSPRCAIIHSAKGDRGRGRDLLLGGFPVLGIHEPQTAGACALAGGVKREHLDAMTDS